MSITLLYFASLREALGSGREEVDLPPDVASIAALRAYLVARGGEWQALAGPRIRAALNQSLAAETSVIGDGDEVAFFPPVTGG